MKETVSTSKEFFLYSNKSNSKFRVNDYTCGCEPGYKGRHCETDINECEPNPCNNGADCTNLLNTYKCNCKDGIGVFNETTF